MRNDGLGFDDAACDDCGLCVVACPTEALTLPAPALLRITDAPRAKVMQSSWLMACDHAALERQNSSPSAGRIPCLYAFAPGWLWQQAGAQHIESIVATTGDCTKCPRGAAGADWHRQWSAVSAAGPTHGPVHPAPTLQIVEPQTWQALAAVAATQQETMPGRRAFFRRLAVPTRNAADVATAPLSSNRRWLTQQLAHPWPSARHRPLWAVDLDETRCSACLDCTRLCPTQALRGIGANAGGHDREQFIVDMAHCIGCGLCVAVCDDMALRPARPEPSSGGTPPHSLPLQKQVCSACGMSFYRLVRSPAAQREISREKPRERLRERPLCRACERGQPLRHDRIVQIEPSAESVGSAGSPPPHPPAP
jgi:ferredoxin